MNYGRYQIVSELGKGSMGMVYQAHDPQIDRQIALKVLREDRLTSQDYVQRFLKEATAIGRLSHPGIVTVYDVGQDHGTIFIAMEFLEGQPLDQLAAHQAMDLSDVVGIGAQVARALHYAHEKGIVHRDIKPPNIIVSRDGEAKVTDFGIAHIDDPDGQQMTRAGEILGTPVYMAPEQVTGQPVDGRSDLYSLGVILYELATGQRPFQGENLAAVFHAITQDDPVSPDKLNPEIPPALTRLILRTMARNPADRFATGRELAELLDTCLESRDQPPDSKPAIKQRRFVPILVTSVVLILILSAGLIGFRYLKSSPSGSDNQPTTDSTPAAQRDNSIELQQVPSSTATNTTEPQQEQRLKSDKADQQVPASEVDLETSATEVWKNDKPISSPGPAKKEKKTAHDEEEALRSIDELFSGDGSEEEIHQEQRLVPQDQGKAATQQQRKFPSTAMPTAQPDITTASLQPKNEQKPSNPPVAMATLKINSRPQGARLYMDGDYKGITPIDLHAAAKKHEVKLELQGHLNWHAQLDLSRGGEIPLSVRLVAE